MFYKYYSLYLWRKLLSVNMTNESITLGYLGPQFQEKVFWQILTEEEFGDKIIEHLDMTYFDDDNMKKLFRVIKNYYVDYGKVPNLQNKSIFHAIGKYHNIRDITEEEILKSIINKIDAWNYNVLNGTITSDGEAIRKETLLFVKQQEYAKFGYAITNFVTTGKIKDKNIVAVIDEMHEKIAAIGDEEDYGTNLFENVDKVFQKDFRSPIGTGIKPIDEATGGGLGKGEMGIILAATGVGKTTILTFLANEAVEMGNNVLQIIFEDTPDQVKRKHYVKWTPKAELQTFDYDEENRRIKECVAIKKAKIKGNLIIKRFPQEGITMPKIHQWVKKYEKKSGVKFNILILDYLDCVESHKKSADQTQSEIAVVKYFESMCAELNIPCWTALQSNRSGINAEWIDTSQMGGSIKRAQKSHFLMSVAKSSEQTRNGMANIQILKSRFGNSGLVFENAVFNNNTMEIKIYNTSLNKTPIQINKPAIENNKMVEQEPNRSQAINNVNLTELLNKDRKEIEEENYDDNFEIMLNSQASELPRP